MLISPTITQHTVVLCVEKRERGIGMQTLLSKYGFRVVMALSLYDALKYIAQEMPHLVITESVLSDGSAGTLYDRLQQHETLKKTPILVSVLKKTKEELAPLAQRRFAGFILGPLDSRAFLQKVNEVITAYSMVSPYFVTADQASIEKDVTLSIEAMAMGRSGDQLVARSTAEVDPAASMLCVPTNEGLGPAVLRMATNLKEGEEIFNLFPLARIVGAGRKWVMNLPEIKLGEKSALRHKLQKVIFYDPSDSRFEGFRDILKGYGIDLLHAKTTANAAAMLKRDPDGVACVYLHELMNDASGIEWKNVYSKLSAAQKPPIIVGTSSMNSRSTAAVRYIKRPFGMGLFVEMLQASFERGGELAQVAGKAYTSTSQGIAVRYQAPATLVGIDETGGILQVKFPLLKGSKVSIGHKFLTAAWDGISVVQVTASAAQPGKPDVWHARFEAVTAGMSKVKYWDKLSKQLEAKIAAEQKAAS